MEKYNYKEVVAEDLYQFILQRYSKEEIVLKIQTNRRTFESEISYELFLTDEVTGYPSGSYINDRQKTEKYIATNLNLLGDALNNFFYSVSDLQRGAEWLDTIIRIYVAQTLIPETLNKILVEFQNNKD